MGKEIGFCFKTKGKGLIFLLLLLLVADAPSNQSKKHKPHIWAILTPSQFRAWGKDCFWKGTRAPLFHGGAKGGGAILKEKKKGVFGFFSTSFFFLIIIRFKKKPWVKVEFLFIFPKWGETFLGFFWGFIFLGGKTQTKPQDFFSWCFLQLWKGIKNLFSHYFPKPKGGGIGGGGPNFSRFWGGNWVIKLCLPKTTPG